MRFAAALLFACVACVACVAFVACGQATSPSSRPCAIELSGNFVEGTHACPTLAAGAGATRGHTLLQLAAPSRTIGGSFAITIDLGASPTIGPYRSATTDLWSANGSRHVAPNGACLFQAGNNTTPTGDFTLDLTSIDATTAHGTLAIRMFVLPRASDAGRETDCGSGTTEELHAKF